MPESFFERPILTSPYEYPARHWELDESGHPTNRIVETRRRAEFITPIPGPKKRRLGLQRVFDLSATPFFLRGSGYAQGTLFPWR